MASERRLKYPLLWLLFVPCMLTGAGLISSSVEWRRVLGLALLVLPLVGFLGLAFAYYALERWRASRGQ